MKPCFLFFFTLLAGCISGGGPQLSETIIGDIVLIPQTAIGGNLALLMPEGFEEMDEEMLKIKYPNEHRPTLVFTNERGSINVAMNHTKTRMPANNIVPFHKQMDDMFRRSHPAATWFNSGLIDINDRIWFTLNLRTPAIDTEVRNIIVGTSLKDRLFLFTFNVTKDLEEQWLEVGEMIIQSLHIIE